MINRQALLKDLQRLLPTLEQDILDYSETNAEVGERLRNAYREVKSAGRTAEHFSEWRDAQITQGAVAWVLACVFVRFLEDNDLLDEPLLAGPSERLRHARDRLTVFFQHHPALAERDYLLAIFDELLRYPAMSELLDPTHNPLWQPPAKTRGVQRKVKATTGTTV